MAVKGRQSVRVLGHDCEECFSALKADCASIGFPRVGDFAVVPVSWLEATCSHGRDGVRLEPVEPDNGGEYVPTPGGRSEGQWPAIENQKAFQQSRWRELFPDGIDATKGIGYPARETGRYGSHPQHDGSEDD